MGMKSVHKGRAHVLSTTLLATLFLCQVVGSLCLMVPPVGAMAPTLHDVHAGHAMGDSRMCQDSVPSSSKSQGAPATHVFPLPESLHSALTVQHSAPGAHLITGLPLSASAPPLYTRLSTFRI